MNRAYFSLNIYKFGSNSSFILLSFILHLKDFLYIYTTSVNFKFIAIDERVSSVPRACLLNIEDLIDARRNTFIRKNQESPPALYFL